jgi:hypothetical protein
MWCGQHTLLPGGWTRACLMGCATLLINSASQAQDTRQAPMLARHRAATQAQAQFVPGGARNAHVPGKPWHGPVVYAAPTSRGVVNVYRGGTKQPKQPLYSFALYPGVANSLQVDKHGNLYLADTYSTWVFEYAPGTNTPLNSFPTSEPPDEIAVRGKTLYVFQSAPDGGDASVQIYENGQTKPSRSLSDGAIEDPSGLAVDGAGNVFVGYLGPNFTEGVGEFVKGKMPMVPLNLAGVVLPLALAVDPDGNLLVDSVGDGNDSTIYIYPPGQTTASGSIPNLPWLYQFSLTRDGSAFYAGPTSGSAFEMYAYPSGTPIYSFTDSDAYVGFAGIAASPGVKPGVWGTQK